MNWTNNYASSPIEDINKAMAEVKKYMGIHPNVIYYGRDMNPYHGQPTLYCAADGLEINTQPVIQHLCVEGIASVCVDLNFCSENCLTFWTFRNQEAVHKGRGKHGCGYNFVSTEQFPTMIHPPIKHTLNETVLGTTSKAISAGELLKLDDLK